MTFTRKQIYAAAAVFIAAAVLFTGNSLFTEWKLKRLERTAGTSAERAKQLEREADEMERASGQSLQKIEYLETKIAEIGAVARSQDEEIKELRNITRGARADVERARRVRAITANADELCERLAELGHACD